MDSVCIRRAVFNDINTLAEHHMIMFKEICVNENRVISDEILEKIFNTTIKKLTAELPIETCVAWIIEKNGKTAGSGSISIASKTASPISPDTYMAAYLHSVFIHKDFRGSKLTRLILDKAEKYCRKNNISEITLRASKAGKPTYDASGYKPVTNYMNKILK